MEKSEFEDLRQLTCTAATLQSILDLSQGRVSQLRSEGVIVRRGTDEYALLDSLKNFISRYASRQGRVSADERSERTRLTSAKADRAEMEAAELRGQLVRRDVQIRDAFAEARSLRDGFMGLADRLTPDLVHLDDEVEIHRLVTREVQQVLNQLIEAEKAREAELAVLEQLETETP